MLKFLFRTFVLTALAVFALTGQAAAAIITFEGHIPTNDGATVEIQDGFQFTFTANGWGIFEDSFVGGGAPYTHNGTARLMAQGGNAYVDIRPLDLIPFSLGGFDAATMFPDFRGQIQVTGQLALGGSVAAVIDLSDSFTPFTLSGFSDLTSVRVMDLIPGAYRGGPGFALDNLSINENVIPEPASLLLLGTGTLALVAKVRRRRQID